MFKRIFFLLTLLSIASLSYTQFVSRHVFLSGGELLDNEQLGLSISIGQAGLVGSFLKGNIEFNLGFQQMESSASTSIEDISHSNQILVFPNPFTDQITIEFKAPYSNNFECFLFNSLGFHRLHWDKHYFGENERIKTIDTRFLLPGIYQLVIYIYSERKILKVYHKSLISL